MIRFDHVDGKAPHFETRIDDGPIALEAVLEVAQVVLPVGFNLPCFLDVQRTLRLGKFDVRFDELVNLLEVTPSGVLLSEALDKGLRQPLVKGRADPSPDVDVQRRRVQMEAILS